MKTTFASSLLVLGYSSIASAATLFFNDFESETGIPAGWTANNNIALWTDPSYAQSGSNTLTIVEARDTNFVTTPTLDLTGATEATISFFWSTGPNSGAFGRFTQIEYSSDGANFVNIGQIALPANTVQTSPVLFSETIDVANDGFAFTANSAFRIVGDNDSGGGGAPLAMDDFTVVSDANPVPEPQMAMFGSLGLLLLLRRRS